MRRTLAAVCIGTALVTGACGMAEPSGTDTVSADGSSAASGFPAIDTIAGREVIASLEQTVGASPERERAAKAELASPDYQQGMFGEPSDKLAEDLAVQAIEGPAAIAAVDKVYGNDGFAQEGVIFFENQAQGAGQSGIWIGVKMPDDRVWQVLELLQPQVDAGEILAAPIYFYRSAHSQQELFDRQDEVTKALKAVKGERGSYAVSANLISGDLTVGHDFLKEAQQQALGKQFPDTVLHFEQEGRMVAEPGHTAVIRPEKDVSETPVTEGGFLLSASPGSFFVAGGTEGAVFYTFEESEELPVGRRVKVEGTGVLMESEPAQGEAKFVEILPDYHPAGAALSESQAIVQAIEGKTPDDPGYLKIKQVTYDAERGVWLLEVYGGHPVEIADR